MKTGTVLIILLIVAAIAIFSFNQLFASAPQTDAKKFFEEDLKESYPYADVREVLSINKVGALTGEYYVLKARVSSGMDTPCPERIEVEYNYPSRNFVKTDEKVVSGCQVCIEDKENCHISYPEEAIIASHTYNGTQRIAEYIKTYKNPYPLATLLPELDGEKNVWEVSWDSNESSYLLTAYISQRGNQVISILEQGKQ
jgi:hypothetical protein